CFSCCFGQHCLRVQLTDLLFAARRSSDRFETPFGPIEQKKAAPSGRANPIHRDLISVQTAPKQSEPNSPLPGWKSAVPGNSGLGGLKAKASCRSIAVGFPVICITFRYSNPS